jgi:hypothetical protein
MIEKVQDLSFRADFFLESYLRLRSVLTEEIADPVKRLEFHNLPLWNFAMLNANLYFFETISCVASMLRDNQINPTKNEILFHGLGGGLPATTKASFQAKLNLAFGKYKSSGLKEMRDTYVDHKNLNSSGDPSAAFINLIRQDLVDSCTRLLQDLNRLFEKLLSDRTTNNYFSDFYSPEVNEYIQFVSERLQTFNVPRTT